MLGAFRGVTRNDAAFTRCSAHSSGRSAVTENVPLTRRQLRALEEGRALTPAAVPVPTPPANRDIFASFDAATTPVVPMSQPVAFAPLVEAPVPGPQRRSAKAPKKAVTRAPRASRSPKPARRAGAYSPLFSTVAMLFAGALLVGVSVPANAFITETDVADAPVATKEAVPSQTLAIAGDLDAASVTRDAFSVTSHAEMLRIKYGNRSYGYSATSGAVRWPFPNAVPISDGYGERVSPCRGCSSFHKGVDFTPGAGTAIFAIAKGTVVASESTNNGFGTQVAIEHVIKGQKVTSFYGHMKAGSVPLKVGQTVAVGDFVGLVGATGAAMGAHLHLEIWLDGVQVDPYAWLKRNASN